MVTRRLLGPKSPFIDLLIAGKNPKAARNPIFEGRRSYRWRTQTDHRADIALDACAIGRMMPNDCLQASCGYLIELLTAAAALRVLVLISDANFFRSCVVAGARASEATKRAHASLTADFHSYGSRRTSTNSGPSPSSGALRGWLFASRKGDEVKALVCRPVIISLHVVAGCCFYNEKGGRLSPVAQRPTASYFAVNSRKLS